MTNKNMRFKKLIPLGSFPVNIERNETNKTRTLSSW